MHGLLDPLPLWSILPITVAGGFISVESGYRLASYRHRRNQEEKESPVGGMVGATLGLLAFMLAFTFGLAGSRFEDRRQVLLSEANAIGTTYRRAAMLPEPMRTEARNLLREYVDVRLEAVQQPGKLKQALSRSEELHNSLWSLAVQATEKDRSPIAVFALILGFSSVLYLIADLDRPGQGTLQLSQQSMIDLRQSMK